MKNVINAVWIWMLLLSACDRDDACDFIKTRGERVTVERVLPPFHSITVRNGIHVRLSYGDDYSATIVGWKNLMSGVRLTVDAEGALLLEDANRFKFLRSRDNMTIVHLRMAGELNHINFAGNGDFATQDTLVTSGLVILSEGSGALEVQARTPSLYIGTNHRNTASITVSGRGADVGITNWGYSPVDVYGFKALRVSVAQRGTGDARVFATESVHVDFLSGVGDVYYGGHPPSVTFTRREKGKGQLLPTE